MEPVRGGRLANVPEQAQALMTGGSPASYAIRFAAGWDNVMMVLSGMSNMEQMRDNLSYMTDFKPLNEAEREIVARTCAMIQAQRRIPCTACEYCVAGCPAGINIPEVFACYNEKKRAEYKQLEAKASACVACGACEAVCPQRLEIRELLNKVATKFKE